MITGGPSVVEIVSAWLPVPVPLVAVTVALKLPIKKVVPEIKPVLVFTVMPVGKPLAPKLLGPLVPVI